MLFNSGHKKTIFAEPPFCQKKIIHLVRKNHPSSPFWSSFFAVITGFPILHTISQNVYYCVVYKINIQEYEILRVPMLKTDLNRIQSILLSWVDAHTDTIEACQCS